MKNWHIIKEYNHKANTILCACDWLGPTGDDWVAHRKEKEGEIPPKGFNPKKLQYAPGMLYRTVTVKFEQ